jgi:hypothetical protein
MAERHRPTAEVEMSAQSSRDSATEAPRDSIADMKLEVVGLPVTNVDRAKSAYERLGWRLDADFATGEDFRVVQLTPPRPSGYAGCMVAEQTGEGLLS